VSEHDDKLPGKGSTRKADEAIMAMRPTWATKSISATSSTAMTVL